MQKKLKISHDLYNGTFIELILTIIPALILILISFPSFKLLFLMDEMCDPDLSVLAEGDQWYFNFQHSDYLSAKEVYSYLFPNSELEYLESNFEYIESNFEYDSLHSFADRMSISNVLNVEPISPIQAEPISPLQGVLDKVLGQKAHVDANPQCRRLTIFSHEWHDKIKLTYEDRLALRDTLPKFSKDIADSGVKKVGISSHGSNNIYPRDSFINILADAATKHTAQLRQ